MNEPARRDVTVFNAALELPPEERAAFLKRACDGDANLLREVEALIEAHERAQDFLAPAHAVRAMNRTERSAVPVAEKPGDRIGRYKLLQQIGEGGCGVVYMAEQEEPVRRRVALKIIKLGMDTKQVIARFEAERQALALMDHPNIARVFDAGSTATGRPYFVMELVRGVKITEYCDQSGLTTTERLQLFIRVCQAIQHAHQKGIIHRDLKPSNILVTVNDGLPVPKVIDFGIAKATQGRLTDQTLFTAFEQFIGTPAYMSPEQAVMTSLDVDTRSDIYSLGVLLYELLTGRTPFDSRSLLEAGLDEMRRTIREKEPLKPSTQLRSLTAEELTTAAQRRRTEAPNLIHVVRGDLDWIVMKCLEKDRARRYETANGLAADLQRHLSDEPVAARPPSKLYEFQKTVRRHKFGFFATAAVILALAGGLAVSWKLYLEARSERKKAQTEAVKSDQIARFLKDMLKSVEPSVALGRDTAMLREILDKTAGRISHDLKDQPDVEAEILNDIGEVYSALGQYEDAERLHRRALAIQVQLWGTNHLDAARSLHNLARALLAKGENAGAEHACLQALEIRLKLAGPEHVSIADSLNLMGLIRERRGNLSEAERLLNQALAMRRKLLDAEHPSIAASLGNVGWLLQRQGKPDAAEPLLREALSIQRKLWGNDDLRVARLLSNLAATHASQAEWAQAEVLQREALEKNRALFGHVHPVVAGSLHDLAGTLQRQGKLNEIEALFRDELARARERYPNHVPIRSDCINRLLDVLLQNGEFSKVEELIDGQLTPALQMQPRSIGLLFNRAEYLARCSRWKEAAADLLQLVEIDPAREYFANALALVQAEMGDMEAYHQHCRRILPGFSETQDPPTAERIAKACLIVPSSREQVAAASRLADKAVTLGGTHPFLPYLELAKGLAEYRLGNLPAAKTWLEQSLGHHWSDHNLNAPARLVLAMTFQKLGQPDQAALQLADATARIRNGWAHSSSGDLGDDWRDLLIARILEREAKELIQGSSD